jgi:hypothetical protein
VELRLSRRSPVELRLSRRSLPRPRFLPPRRANPRFPTYRRRPLRASRPRPSWQWPSPVRRPLLTSRPPLTRRPGLTRQSRGQLRRGIPMARRVQSEKPSAFRADLRPLDRRKQRARPQRWRCPTIQPRQRRGEVRPDRPASARIPDRRERVSRPGQVKRAQRRVLRANVRSNRSAVGALQICAPKPVLVAAMRTRTTQTMSLRALAVAAAPGRPLRIPPLAAGIGRGPVLTLPVPDSRSTNQVRLSLARRRRPRPARSTRGPMRSLGARMARRPSRICSKKRTMTFLARSRGQPLPRESKQRPESEPR